VDTARRSPAHRRTAGWPIWLLVALGAAAAVGLAFTPAIRQPQAYHHFVDVRTLLAIPNAFNVLSNLPFACAGLIGLILLREGGGIELPLPLRRAYQVVAAGVFLTGFGSAYYHWAPSDATLLWDRLPMSMAFMGLLAAVLGERVGLRAAALWLWPFVAFGIASVLYWHWSDDLRLYVLTQFYPLLTIPLMIALLPAMYTRGGDFFAALGLYVVAKLLEEADGAIFKLTAGIVSGHTLKHLAAAAGAWWVLRMLLLRRPASPS
jgi:hypothetical protein